MSAGQEKSGSLQWGCVCVFAWVVVCERERMNERTCVTRIEAVAPLS